jgi:hypothetical protein
VSLCRFRAPLHYEFFLPEAFHAEDIVVYFWLQMNFSGSSELTALSKILFKYAQHFYQCVGRRLHRF